jgi:hypothetical protein
VRNIEVKNGRNEEFPEEDWNPDISGNDYLKRHEAYSSFKKVVTGGDRRVL